MAIYNLGKQTPNPKSTATHLHLDYEFYAINKTPLSLTSWTDPLTQKEKLFLGYKEGLIEQISLQTWESERELNLAPVLLPNMQKSESDSSLA